MIIYLELTNELNEVVTTFKNHSKKLSTYVQGLFTQSFQYDYLGINAEIKRIGNLNDAVSRMKKDQTRTVTRTFQNVLVDFNTEQVNYKEKCEKKISDYLKIGKQCV